MHLAFQEFPWWQLAQAQDNRRQQADMVERLEGDSSEEYLDAREGSEEETTGGMDRSAGGSSSRVTEERIIFDRLDQRVHEPDLPPPGRSVHATRPLGPPAPQPLSAVREISHAVAIAVGRAMGIEGQDQPGLVVAHVPPYWRTMRRVAIHLTTFAPTDWSHPHVLESWKLATIHPLPWLRTRQACLCLQALLPQLLKIPQTRPLLQYRDGWLG